MIDSYFCNDAMNKHELLDITKVNAAPMAGLLATISGLTLDDWVKLTTIAAMVVSIIYTIYKGYKLYRAGHPKAVEPEEHE